MSDIKGDATKRPPECQEGTFIKFDENFKHDPMRDSPNATGRAGRCPHLKGVHESWDSETYECAVCGTRYTLYDDEMR